MPTWLWWSRSRRLSCSELSIHIAEPLFVVSACQANAERINSAYAHVVEGRVALHTANASMLTYIYWNSKALLQFQELQRVDRLTVVC